VRLYARFDENKKGSCKFYVQAKYVQVELKLVRTGRSGKEWLMIERRCGEGQALYILSNLAPILKSANKNYKKS
jgi:hypothetical protein